MEKKTGHTAWLLALLASVAGRVAAADPAYVDLKGWYTEIDAHHCAHAAARGTMVVYGDRRAPLCPWRLHVHRLQPAHQLTPAPRIRRPAPTRRCRRCCGEAHYERYPDPLLPRQKCNVANR